MSRLTDEVREESPWTVMFADDIMIFSEFGAGGQDPVEV